MNELKLRDYQEAGVSRLKSQKNLILAMEPGLGKTATTLLGCEYPALIVCPSAAAGVWEDEIAKWVPHVTAVLPRNRKEAFDLLSRKYSGEFKNTAVIVTYDFFTKSPRYYRFASIVFDEAHYLKNPTAARTIRYKQVVAQLCDAKIILVTGTPMPNRPIELHALLYGVGAPYEEIGTYHQFGIKFSGGYWNTYFNCWRYDKATNLDTLKGTLAKHMFIRLKADVMSELPPITWQLVRLQRTGAVARISAFEQSTLREAKMQTIIDERNLSESLNRGELAMLLAEQGKAKAAIATKMIQEFLEETNKKLIVFAWHTHVIDYVCTRIKQAVRYTGATARAARIAAVKAFQTDTNVRVFVGNIQAAGVAITLTEASDVLFIETNWSPADLRQAAERAHRIGQHNPVTAKVLTYENSIDELVLRVVLRKTEEINKTLSNLDEYRQDGVFESLCVKGE